MDRNQYQSLWKRQKFTVGMGAGEDTRDVNGVVIAYFGIWKPKDCAQCKGY